MGVACEAGYTKLNCKTKYMFVYTMYEQACMSNCHSTEEVCNHMHDCEKTTTGSICNRYVIFGLCSTWFFNKSIGISVKTNKQTKNLLGL